MRTAGRARTPRVADVEFVPCACASIRRASRAVTQFYNQWLHAHGIEGPEFALLAMLDRVGESNQTTMGQRFDLDKTTLSRNLKRLAKQGWIETEKGADGRERRIRLTNPGRQRLAAARPAWRNAQARLRTALSEHDWEETLHRLNALTRAARLAQRPSGAARR